MNQRESTTESRDDATYGPIVDVLVLGAALAAAATDHSDRIDVEQDAPLCTLPRRLWVEDRRVAKWELPRVYVLRVLVEQEPEVGRRLMGRSNGQEHVLLPWDSRSPVYRAVRSPAAFV